MMKRLYKHCQTCGKLTYMGDFCADLEEESKQKAIAHLFNKHRIGDQILMGWQTDDIDIGYPITPNLMDDIDLPVTQITESSYKEKPYSYNDIKREEEEE